MVRPTKRSIEVHSCTWWKELPGECVDEDSGPYEIVELCGSKFSGTSEIVELYGSRLRHYRYRTRCCICSYGSSI
uniref:Putative ovule protein n=1 Tax=Solanum chacoense TaxID=4108 RepID=A0A0V0HC16_SOLCH